MRKQSGNALVWILIVGAIIAVLFIFNGNEDDPIHDDSYLFRNSGYQEEDRIIDRYDAIYDYWDEIKDYVAGTETIDACSSESGNCYSLDAEISNGQIEMIYFPDGGYLYFSADIDENGNASDFDRDGNSWDFTLDMDSSIVEDAVYDWASDNDYVIE